MINLEKQLIQVGEFSEAFGFEKTKFNKGFVAQRYKLLNEEYEELIEAIKEKNKVEILDALCDMQYITLGSFYLLDIVPEYMHRVEEIEETIDQLRVVYTQSMFEILNGRVLNFIHCTLVDFGLLSVFEKAFDLVHESNMSKFCDSLETVHRTLAQDRYKGVASLSYVQRGSKYFVTIGKNDIDLAEGKLIKSIDYKPVDFSVLL